MEDQTPCRLHLPAKFMSVKEQRANCEQKVLHMHMHIRYFEATSSCFQLTSSKYWSFSKVHQFQAHEMHLKDAAGTNSEKNSFHILHVSKDRQIFGISQHFYLLTNRMIRSQKIKDMHWLQKSGPINKYGVCVGGNHSNGCFYREADIKAAANLSTAPHKSHVSRGGSSGLEVRKQVDWKRRGAEKEERRLTDGVGEDGEAQGPNVEEAEPNGGQSEWTHQHQPPA